MFNFIRSYFSKRATTPQQAKPVKSRRHREFVVIGLGRFGQSLAQRLIEEGHDVLAVDLDENLVQRLSNQLPHVVHMDATNKEGLVELGIETFDTGIVCIGSDFESNILATVLLRQFGVRRVICKARTRTQRDILLKIGADEVILPEHEAGMRLAKRLGATGMMDFMEVNQEISVVEFLAPSHLIGQTLAKSNLREKHGLVVVAIRRLGQVNVLPTAQEVISQDDVLVVIGRTGASDAFFAT